MSTAWVITACRDRRAITARFLDQLAMQTWRPLHLVVVDDGSSDGTTGLLTGENRFPVTLLPGDGNLFWGGAMHRILRHLGQRADISGADSIIFMNDDTTFLPGFIAQGMGSLPANGCMLFAINRDSTSGRIIDAGQICGGWRLRPRPVVAGEYPTCVPTRGLFVRWSDIQLVGNFIPWALPHYGSDYEWTIRAVRCGLHIITDPGFSLDLIPAATGIRSSSELRRTGARSRLSRRRYAEHPFTLIRLAGRIAPWPRAAVELVFQLLRWLAQHRH